MSVRIHTFWGDASPILCTDDNAAQVFADLQWNSRGKWYVVSSVTLTHNPEYPTPTINVVEPAPGIGFKVVDRDGNTVYSNRKEK